MNLSASLDLNWGGKIRGRLGAGESISIGGMKGRRRKAAQKGSILYPNFPPFLLYPVLSF